MCREENSDGKRWGDIVLKSSLDSAPFCGLKRTRLEAFLSQSALRLPWKGFIPVRAVKANFVLLCVQEKAGWQTFQVHIPETHPEI